MARNYAIIIGINHYEFCSTLKYAENDAQHISRFLSEKLNFEDVILLVHTSENRKYKPIRSRILDLLSNQANDYTSRLNAEDSLWFFFSGHGVRYRGCDYLMPSDGNPAAPKETAISLPWIREQLSRSGAENVVMILDACRNEGQKGGGFGSKLKGITTIYSCKAEEQSWEISEIQQGSFTYALLENFQHQINQGRGQTVKQVENALRHEVIKLNKQYGKVPQTPHIQCDSISDAEKILLPQFAADVNVERLKNLALEAEIQGNISEAIALWNRILGFCKSHQERTKTSDNIQRLAQKQQRISPHSSPPRATPSATPRYQYQTPHPSPPRKPSNSSPQKKTAKGISMNSPVNAFMGTFDDSKSSQSKLIVLLQNPVILAAITISIWSLLGLLLSSEDTSKILPLFIAFGAFGGLCSSALAALAFSQCRLSGLRRILPLYLLIGFVSGAISWPIVASLNILNKPVEQGFLLGILSACMLLLWVGYHKKA